MTRQLPIDELDKLLPLAEKFYASSEALKEFRPEAFKHNWTTFISNDLGVIFVLEEEGRVIGAIGGIKAPDVNSGDPVATEFFWFVAEGSRGGGIALLRKFEGWAREQGCKRITMAFLSDLMPGKVKALYERLGYTEMEVHYTKEI